MKCPQLSFAFKAKSKADSETTPKAYSKNRFLDYQLKLLNATSCNQIPDEEAIMARGVKLSLRSLEPLDYKSEAKANPKTGLKTEACTIQVDESNRDDASTGLEQTIAYCAQSLSHAFGQLISKAGSKLMPNFHSETPRNLPQRDKAGRNFTTTGGNEVERHGFLALPPEIRLMIYEQSFDSNNFIKIPTSESDRIPTPALLQINSETRREAEAIYYAVTRFIFEFNRNLNLLSMSTTDFSGLTLNVSFPDPTLRYLRHFSRKNFLFVTKLQLQYWAYDADVMSLLKINVDVPNNGPASYARSDGRAVRLTALDNVVAELSARHAPGKLGRRDVFTIADALAGSMVQEE
ncbi:hypothetical protein BDV97DRAFT_130149 [Delphinella strobiligena]|nr:hypothetical protein BDV97DRAFT_130149 [Delphinella strobiligena]